MAEDGRQRPELTLPDGVLSLCLAALWYAAPATGAMGPVETPLPAKLVQAMLSSPWLVPAVALRVRAEMARRWPQQDLPAPAPILPPERLNEPLQPVLHLLAGDLPFDPAIGAAGHHPPSSPQAAYRIPLARLMRRYGPVVLQAAAERNVIMHDGRLLEVVRDRAAEAKARGRLHHLGFGQIGHHHLLPAP